MDAGPEQSGLSLENLVFGAGYCKPTSSEVTLRGVGFAGRLRPGRAQLLPDGPRGGFSLCVSLPLIRLSVRSSSESLLRFSDMILAPGPGQTPGAGSSCGRSAWSLGRRVLWGTAAGGSPRPWAMWGAE